MASNEPLNVSSNRQPDWFQRFAQANKRNRWQPIPRFSWTIGFFLVVTIIALPVGGGMFYAANQNVSSTHRYDDFSPELSNVERKDRVLSLESTLQTRVTFQIDKKMESPVYVYYELTAYHQNHKRYVRSLNEQQLGGEDPDPGNMPECDPYRYVPLNAGGAQSSSEREVIKPCGLVAHSLFNDSFVLISSESQDGDSIDLAMDESGIATEWDRKYLYADEPAAFFNHIPALRGGGQIRGNLSDDEHFMVWMRVGARPTVRKLYGIIRSDIPKGAKLNFAITHHYNTYDFNGKKKLILTTSNWTGGRNEFTGIIYFVTGALSAVACIVILGWDLKTDRKPGDLRSLSWIRNA